MEKFKLEKWQKICLALCGIGLLCSILFFIPFVQNLALDFGENVLVHRPLTREVWVARFVRWGIELCVAFVGFSAVIVFWEKISLVCEYEVISKNEKLDTYFTLFAFLFFIFIGCFKLTYAGLWFDETIEFYFSKIMFGQLPWGSATNSMYERIIATYQPPLYNFLMFFWLKISETEWWFKFFGVLAGLFGAIGIYKTSNLLLNSKKVASFAVILYALIPRQVYYIQEASEYCLLLAFLPWCIYYFTSIIIEPNKSNIVLLALFSVLSVYSQYGAAFPVATMLIIALIKVLKEKNIELKKFIILTYAFCLIFAAIPLYCFFIRIQIKSQATQPGWASNDLFSIKNLLTSPVKIFNFLLLPNYGKIISSLVFSLCFILGLIDCITCENNKIRFFYISVYATYTIFVIAVSLHIYSYGSFSPDRYKLFLLPYCFLLVFVPAIRIEQILSIIKHSVNFETGIKLFFVLILIIYIIGNGGMVLENWKKQDIREVVQIWNDEKLYEKPTFICQEASSGFYYYATHPESDDIILNHVVFETYRNHYTVEQTKNSITETFNSKLPTEFSFIGSHIDDNVFEIFINSFNDLGYNFEIEYDANSARLVKLKR